MNCKSCTCGNVVLKNLCKPCLSDYRYNTYRRYLEKKQAIAGAAISSESKRWSKESMKLLRNKIKTEINKSITAKEVMGLYQVTESLAYKVIREVRNG